MKKINFCKATTIILIINVILSIVLFFVVPDKIAIQWVGTVSYTHLTLPTKRIV